MDEPEQHGIDTAYYSNTPYGLRSFMSCLCGWSSGPGSSWRESGEELDDHLTEVSTPKESAA